MQEISVPNLMKWYRYLFHLLCSGNSLPTHLLRAGYSVRYENSFLVVGGSSTVGGSTILRDSMLQYRPETDTWAELPGKLRTPRSEHIAIVVDLAIFPACP